MLLAEYKAGVKKWRSGTGGGSGNPINFHNWDDVSVFEFAGYGGGLGRAVRKEWLSYLLLLDMKTDFAFSASFESPPTEAVMEDGDVANQPRLKKLRTGSLEDSTDELAMIARVTASVEKLADVIVKSHSSPSPKSPQVEGTNQQDTNHMRSKLNDMMIAGENVDKLEARRQMLEDLPDDAPMRKERLEMNQMALLQAYKIMQSFYQS